MLTTVIIIWLFKWNWSGIQDSTEILSCSFSICVELLSLGLSHELGDALSSKLLALFKKNVLFSNSLALTFNCFHVPHYSFLRIHSCLASSPIPWANQFYWVCFTRHPNKPRCVCLFELRLVTFGSNCKQAFSFFVRVCMCLSVSYKQGHIFWHQKLFIIICL